MLFTSTLTAASQTTPPATVRKLLQVGPGDKLGYIIDDGGVRLINATAAEADNDDPVLEHFLGFLAGEIQRSPELLQLMPQSFRTLAEELRNTVKVDHNAPIEGAIEI